MNIDVFASHTHAAEKDIRGKTCVVIDTLRATSVMVTALHNGCAQIIPVSEVEQAMEIKTSMADGRTVLGGERGAKKLTGFDFGNSPLEYTREAVAGKTLVMTTSNGTQAIIKAQSASTLYMGALLNATTVAKAVLKQKKDVVLLCAGTNGRFSIDDCVTAGYIIARMIQYKGRRTIHLDDLGAVCYELYDQHRDDVPALATTARHATILMELGMKADIEHCLDADTVDALPRFEDGRIALD